MTLLAFFEGIPYREDIDFSEHNFTADPYFNFTIQPGEERCFEIAIIDDTIVESRYERMNYYIGLYSNSMPLQRLTGRIRIEDDEGMYKLIPSNNGLIPLLFLLIKKGSLIAI